MSKIVNEPKIKNKFVVKRYIIWGHFPPMRRQCRQGLRQKAGCSDEEIARLCDIAMCGDHGIGKCVGTRLFQRELDQF